MIRRLIFLAVLTAIVVVAGKLAFSDASFTTTSTTTVRATVGIVTKWLTLYSSSQDPDPGDRAGYAHHNNNPARPFVAEGLDSTLTIDWGTYAASNTWYTFDRVFTFRTATPFPTGIPQITVAVSVIQAPGENVQCTATINNVGSSGGAASMTVGPDQKRQVNVRLRVRSKWAPGDQYTPSIVLTVTYPGATAGTTYTIPTVVTVQ